MSEERRGISRTSLVLLGWVAAAAVATTVTRASVSVLGSGLFGSSTPALDADEISAALSATPRSTATDGRAVTEEPTESSRSVGTATEAPSRRPSTPPQRPGDTGEPTVLTSAGGTIVASCSNGLVHVESWTPAQGYRVDHPDTRPGDHVDFEFESGDRDVEVRIRCIDDVPVAEVDGD